MGGILHIAYKLLVNDRANYAALLLGISFAVFLMIEMTSLFAGILSRSSAMPFGSHLEIYTYWFTRRTAALRCWDGRHTGTRT
jgi:hypothetical protein